MEVDEVLALQHLGAQAADNVFINVCKIRQAAREEIGPRTSEQDLQPISEHKGQREGQSQAEPRGVPFPQLALPDLRFWNVF